MFLKKLKIYILRKYKELLMENRTFEFRCFTQRSFIVLIISMFSFALFVTGCLIFLFIFNAAMPLIPKQYFKVIFFCGIIVLTLLSCVLFSISIVNLFRQKMTINVNSYTTNIDDHKKLNQVFQWSALQKVIMFKVENPVGFNQTLILEFDNNRINMQIVKGLIPLLSKKDIDQFLEFIQYLHEQVIKPDFELFWEDRFPVSISYNSEYRYLYVRK